MSGTGKRGPDLLNVIGIVTVGICGAVLTYVSIVLLTAYYMHETTDREHQAAIESPSGLRETVKAATQNNLDGAKEGTIKIDRAIELVLRDAKADPSNLVPAVGPSNQPTVMAEYGRPSDVPKAAAPAAPAAPATAPATTPATTPAPAEQPTTQPGTGTGTGTGAPTAAPGANGP